MLQLHCPYCQDDRDESEFSYGGEAHKPRPKNPDALSDAEWADFLFMQKPSKGPYFERWNHAAGCRKWFNVVRDTVSMEILKTYKTGEHPPVITRNAPDF